jgi:hypothetical protein
MKDHIKAGINIVIIMILIEEEEMKENIEAEIKMYSK